MGKRKGIKKKRGSVSKIVFGSLFLIFAAVCTAASALIRFDEWHELDESLIFGCPKALLVYDSAGELVSVSGREKRIWVPITDIGKHTADAFTAAEDARFYSHAGVDLYRVFGAAWADIKAGGFKQGASTISQQLIKLSHLSPEKTIDRKLEEASLAIDLEKRFTKDEIMEAYLNFVYFGGGFYGIETASLGYFGVHASELTAAQSAQLAGILKSPSNYAPHIDPEASLKRRDAVLGLMHDQGRLTDDEYSEALAEEAKLSPALPQRTNALIEYAVSEAADILGMTRDELKNSGYSVYTSMDTRIQDECERLFSDDSFFPSENAQGAIVVIGAEGRIEAMVGQRGGDSNGTNRAVSAYRQPGSLIKPVLVYAPALELGYHTAASVILDEPTDFGGYEPRNSDDKYCGYVTLREAVARSLNVPAVKVFQDVGPETGMRFAEKMGLDMSGEEPRLPLALGGFTHGVSPLEMAGAYSVFSNGGVFIRPASVLMIRDSAGSLLYSAGASGERVMSEANSFMLTSMLKSAASSGTAKKLAAAGLPIAAKTGTAIDAGGVRDSWCAAYTREHTAAVWMGTDSANEGSLPDTAVGGNQPAALLAELFGCVYSDSVCPDFEMPDGVREVFLDASRLDEGVLYAASEGVPAEFILREYLPEQAGDLPEDPAYLVPKEPSDAGFSFSEDGKPVIGFTAESPAFRYTVLRARSGGAEKEVFVCEGRLGRISFRDESASEGEVYSYRIRVENPSLEGEKKSAVSRKLRVVVPYLP